MFVDYIDKKDEEDEAKEGGEEEKKEDTPPPATMECQYNSDEEEEEEERRFFGDKFNDDEKLYDDDFGNEEEDEEETKSYSTPSSTSYSSMREEEEEENHYSSTCCSSSCPSSSSSSSSSYMNEEEEEEEEERKVDTVREEVVDDGAYDFLTSLQYTSLEELDNLNTSTTSVQEVAQSKYSEEDLEVKVNWNPTHSYEWRKKEQDYNVFLKLTRSGIPIYRIVRMGWDACSDPEIPPPSKDTLYNMIPIALKNTLSEIKECIGDSQCVTLTHDGTSKWGREYLGVVVTWIDEDGESHSLPVGFETVEKGHLNASKLNAWLGYVMDELGISPDFVYGTISDRHSINKALNKDYLKNLFANASSLLCCCHAIDSALEKVTTPLVTNFYHNWQWATQSSPFKELFSRYCANSKGDPKYPQVERSIRWGCRFVALEEVLGFNINIKKMFDETNMEDLQMQGATTQKIASLCSVEEDWDQFLIDLSMCVELAQHLTDAILLLEGDGFEIFDAHDIVTNLMEVLESDDLFEKTIEFKNKRNLVGDLSEEKMTALRDPVINYLKAQFKGGQKSGMGDQLNIMGLLRVFNPEYVVENNLTTAQIEGMVGKLSKKMKFVNRHKRDLIEEAANYRELCHRVVRVRKTKNLKKSEYVRNNNSLFSISKINLRDKWVPNWHKLIKAVMSLHPSSASCERIFSQFNFLFHKNQGRANWDLIKVVILRNALERHKIFKKIALRKNN